MPGCCAACCSHAARLVARYDCVASVMRRDEAVYAAPSTDSSFSDRYLRRSNTDPEVAYGIDAHLIARAIMQEVPAVLLLQGCCPQLCVMARASRPVPWWQ